jgi:Spy/CpxP family protein refolding chaperone
LPAGSSEQPDFVEGGESAARRRRADWDLQEETGRMVRLLQQSPIDETRVLERADKVMSLEREIKRAQLTLLIRLKNVLTPEQVAKLEGLRKKGAAG